VKATPKSHVLHTGSTDSPSLAQEIAQSLIPKFSEIRIALSNELRHLRCKPLGGAVNLGC